MDFFQQQEAARRRTGLLVFYFIAAVILIVVLAYAAVDLILVAAGPKGPEGPARPLWDPALFGVVTAGTLLLIGGGSLYRIASLAGGGHTVAESLGGRPISPQTVDPDERKILNVVEEMAIASGTPVPPVYLMDREDGINAFAAGYSPADAVVGVTRGCIRDLSRDELQGVIAHEFSHILNGDMRLNIRLMGVLYGILLISLTGWMIFRTAGDTGRSARNDRDGRKGDIPWPLIGLALYVLGYVGVFFGNLIKAAVGRQREYLADASAVQFTRNPEGIAGALKKIGALAEGSKVGAPGAREASHLFFGDAVGHLFEGLATHPPLVERIRRIDPSFDGDFSAVRLPGPPPPTGQANPPTTFRPAPVRGPGGLAFDPTEMVASIGTVDPRRLAYASEVLGALPGPLRQMAYEPFGARVIVYALLLDPERDSVREDQLRRLSACADAAAFRRVESLFHDLAGLPAESRLPLVSMAVPAIRRLSPDQAARFAACVDSLIQADGRVSLFEYSLRRLVLRVATADPRPPRTPSVATGPPAGPARRVLGTLARVGHADDDDAARAFAEGVRSLGWPGVDAGLPDAEPDLGALDRALDELAVAAPALKKQILAGCASCVGADGRITLEEGELLHAIADSLGCPLPPLRSLPRAGLVSPGGAG